MNIGFSSIFAVAVGAIVVVNGVSSGADRILGDAKRAVNGANVHQIATVLEVYYSDHEHYPDVYGGEELINTLEKEDYILNRPLDPSVFRYETKNGGQDYSLKLEERER